MFDIFIICFHTLDCSISSQLKLDYPKEGSLQHNPLRAHSTGAPPPCTDNAYRHNAWPYLASDMERKLELVGSQDRLVGWQPFLGGYFSIYFIKDCRFYIQGSRVLGTNSTCFNILYKNYICSTNKLK
jgi:hypothetical protein